MRICKNCMAGGGDSTPEEEENMDCDDTVAREEGDGRRTEIADTKREKGASDAVPQSEVGASTGRGWLPGKYGTLLATRKDLWLEDPDDKYYYISEDEEEGGEWASRAAEGNGNGRMAKGQGKDPNIIQAIYDHDQNPAPGRPKGNEGGTGNVDMTCASASGKWTVNSCSSASSSNAPTSSDIPIVDNSEKVWKEIRKLGNIKKIEQNSNKEDAAARIVVDYAFNSIDIQPQDGKKLKVSDIYKIESHHPSSGGGKRSKRKHGSEEELSMYLWYKTTPDSLQRLAAKKDDWNVFFDRLTRALPKPLKDIKENTRLIILLCKVELGKMHLSREGFQKWQWQSVYNSTYENRKSVLGTGGRIPDPGNQEKIGNAIVPFGETIQNRRFPKYNLKYNEYMVKEARRITPKFIVDIDILSK